MIRMFVVLTVLSFAPVANAFCRATTCSTSLCKVDSEGCPAEGTPLFWKTGCIGYSVDARLSQNLPEAETREAIARAFATWSEVDCGGGSFASITFSPLADVSCHKAEFNLTGPNINVVVFQDDDWTYQGTDNSLAKTTLAYDPETGEILGGDIEINTSANKVTVSTDDALYDLQSILAHEVGHLIGLAHSPYAAATMTASYDPGSIVLRSLTTDDLAAACSVYPPGREARCETTPVGGLAKTCRTEGCSAAQTPLAFVFLVPLLRMRKKEDRP